MRELEETPYDPMKIKETTKFICKKLEISQNDFEDLLKIPNRKYEDFRNWSNRRKILTSLHSIYKNITGKKSKFIVNNLIMKISIIDYKLGNYNSIINICKKINLHISVTRDKNEILDSDYLILPGVGSYNVGMKNITEMDLLDTLNLAVNKKKIKTLGICLGLN